MNRNFKYNIAFFMIFLIITIPFYVSNVYAIDKKTVESYKGMEDVTGMAEAEESTPSWFESIFGETNIPDSDEACEASLEETNEFLELMDNDIISTLEKISAILYTLNFVVNTITAILNGLIIILCVLADLPVIGGYFTGVCNGSDKLEQGWSNVKSVVIQPFMMVWLCQTTVGILSWCPSYVNPYDSIYGALGCVCPTAILFNLRKLKTIYQTFNCCVEQACENGLSVDPCYKYLDEATCTYWEGSITYMIAHIIIAIIAAWITDYFVNNLMTKWLAGKMETWKVRSPISIIEAVYTIAGGEKSYEWLSRTFDEPECEDLGFKDIKKAAKEQEPKSANYIVSDSDNNKRMDNVKKIKAAVVKGDSEK